MRAQLRENCSRACGGLLSISRKNRGWPIQAVLWLEWGKPTAAHNFPAARSRFSAVHSDSISNGPHNQKSQKREKVDSNGAR
jgi:hypothetical protein